VSFSHGEPENAQVVHRQWYPKQNDRQVQSGKLSEFIIAIDEYLHLTLDFVESNRDKTNLKRAES
jgi:hypothetical protein